MKRLLVAGLLAVAMAAVADSSAWALGEPGVGGWGRRIGRINGHWIQPTTGPLFDYSLYFAAMYPNMPGAQEVLANPDLYRRYVIPSPTPGDPSYGAGAPFPGPNPTFGRGRRGNQGQYGNGLPPGATLTLPPGATISPPPAAGSTAPTPTTPSR
jgi:hypothetical protein